MMVDSEGQDILPEYQYHLKDHLGNVRLTFTSKPELYESNASIEPDLAAGERADFINYDKVTKINSDLLNHTEGADSHYSIRLSGTEGEKIGLAKSLAVMTGDTIRATVFGKYLDPEQTNYDQLVQNIVATVATGGATGTGTEAGTSAGSDGAFPFAGLLNKTGGDQGVMAYLNYLVFDKEGVLNEGQSGYVALSTNAREDGTGRPHEKLSKEIVVTEPGFVYIYLSNDSPEPLEVIFDDFEVEQVHSVIVQADDYYPFGLSFNSYRRENSVANRYLYNQGTGEKTFRTERVEELGVDMTKYRVYDYAIGRFWQVDPAADMAGQEVQTPYQYSFNNPILYNDPYGDCIPCLVNGIVLRATIASYKYDAIASKAQAPAQRLISGTSGDIPNNVNVDSRTRTIAKVTGTASDVKQVADTGKELVTEAAKDGGGVLDTTGEVIADAGLVAAPFTQGASLVLVPVGEGISATGKGIKTLANLAQGNDGQAATEAGNLALGLVTNKLTSTAIKQSKKVGNITNKTEQVTQESVLGAISSAWNKMVNYFSGDE